MWSVRYEVHSNAMRSVWYEVLSNGMWSAWYEVLSNGMRSAWYEFLSNGRRPALLGNKKRNVVRRGKSEELMRSMRNPFNFYHEEKTLSLRASKYILVCSPMTTTLVEV